MAYHTVVLLPYPSPLFHLAITPSPAPCQPLNHWSLYCLHSFTFSRMLCSWDHTVYIAFFRLALLNKNFNFHGWKSFYFIFYVFFFVTIFILLYLLLPPATPSSIPPHPPQSSLCCLCPWVLFSFWVDPFASPTQGRLSACCLSSSVSVLLVSSVCSSDSTCEWNHMLLVLCLAYFT